MDLALRVELRGVPFEAKCTLRRYCAAGENTCAQFDGKPDVYYKHTIDRLTPEKLPGLQLRMLHSFIVARGLKIKSLIAGCVQRYGC